MEIVVIVWVISYVVLALHDRLRGVKHREQRGHAVYTDKRGYQRYTHNHKLVHRDVMERKWGRKLRPEEVVHHRDRNKKNNHPSNLWVFKNQAEHDAQHERDARKYSEWWSYNGSKRR